MKPKGIRASLVRESIANACIGFQKSTDINMGIHDFLISVFNYPYISVDIHIDIQARISMQGHSDMDIRKQ